MSGELILEWGLSWGEHCPMRFSKAIDQFYILPPAAQSYESYSTRLIAIAQQHSVTLFIPVSGAGNSVEDARAAEEMAAETKGRCRTWIQDPETMLDLHDKDRFMALVERFGMLTPKGRMVTSTSEALAFLMEEGPKDGQGREPKYILKCMGLDENRGDMTLYPLKGDDAGLSSTRKMLEGLRLKITKECPYVFQEFIPGQGVLGVESALISDTVLTGVEWCTHASVLLGQVTAFVTCPSNDMLMTYENATSEVVGKQAEEWTRKLLAKLQQDPTPNGEPRRLTGHFSFDFIQSTKDGQLYPLECNARVHTAVILLPLSKLASCYDPQYQSRSEETLRPDPKTAPRSWTYNDLIMRYLPLLVPSHDLLSYIHPSLPASAVVKRGIRPSEEPVKWRVDPSLIADDWIPFIVLWHVFWPIMLLTRWWQGKKWTRVSLFQYLYGRRAN